MVPAGPRVATAGDTTCHAPPSQQTQERSAHRRNISPHLRNSTHSSPNLRHYSLHWEWSTQSRGVVSKTWQWGQIERYLVLDRNCPVFLIIQSFAVQAVFMNNFVHVSFDVVATVLLFTRTYWFKSCGDKPKAVGTVAPTY